jgi:fucose permease
MLIFFLYTGLEITIGQWIYTLLTEARGLPEGEAGVLTATYWSSIVAGRFILGALTDRIGIDRMLRGCLLASALGIALVWMDGGTTSTGSGLFLAGSGLAPVFPCLMTRTPQRLGTQVSAHAIGMQVGAAMLGSAAWPSLAGVLGQAWGLEAIPGLGVTMAVGLFGLHEGLVRLGQGETPQS